MSFTTPQTPRQPLTVVTNLAAPYRDGLFRELQRLFDVKVYLLAADEPGRRWRRTRLPYTAAHVPALRFPGRQRPWYCPLPIWLGRPGYIVVAGFGLQTILTAIVKPRSTLLWSEATHVTEQARGKLRVLSRRWLIRRCRAAVAAGQASAAYLRDLGARDVVLLPNVIDTPLTRVREQRIRSQSTIVLAHVGDWSVAKGADKTSNVFATLAADPDLSGKRVELVIAGHVFDAPIPDGATYLGYLPHANVWERLRDHGAAFLLLLSKADTWGFVVPEAVAAGLIPVTSSAVGSAPDLLAPVDAGLVVESPEGAAAAIKRLIAAPTTLGTTLRALQSVAEPRTASWAAERFSSDLAAIDGPTATPTAHSD